MTSYNVSAEKVYTLDQLCTLSGFTRVYLHKAMKQFKTLKYTAGFVPGTKIPCNFIKGSDFLAFRKAIDEKSTRKSAHILSESEYAEYQRLVKSAK